MPVFPRYRGRGASWNSGGVRSGVRANEPQPTPEPPGFQRPMPPLDKAGEAFSSVRPEGLKMFGDIFFPPGQPQQGGGAPPPPPTQEPVNVSFNWDWVARLFGMGGQPQSQPSQPPQPPQPTPTQKASDAVFRHYMRYPNVPNAVARFPRRPWMASAQEADMLRGVRRYFQK